MEKDLKEELMRVRAREKRYRNTAEAQIASLQEQLETMKEAEIRAEAARIELENRCRKLEEENALLKKQADSFQAQLEAMKEFEARAASCGVELEKLKAHCQKLESENTLCQEFRQKLKRSDLDYFAVAANFFQSQPQDMREFLRAQGYAVDNLATFFGQCGNLYVFLSLWKAVRQMVVNGAAPDTMKNFLNKMLRLYNQCTQEKLMLTYDPLYHTSKGLFKSIKQIKMRKIQKCVLPGLVDTDGKILVDPLLESKY